MSKETINIGLSLGADICWPASYEEILRRLDLDIEVDGRRLGFNCERVKVEPYNLRYKPKYNLVMDRITHWFPMTREWIKKIAIMDGVYVLNNPWAIQSMEKHTTYCAMMRLGFPIPETWIVPPKEYKDEGDTLVTVRRYNKLFDLNDVGQAVGYPAFMKPYDGGAWVGVKRVTNPQELHAAYNESNIRVQHLQAAVKDWDIFVRGLGIGPQVNVMKYDPSAPLHARYVVDFNYLSGEEWLRATRFTRVINAFFNWDFNSCEMLRTAGEFYPIDFANACPDSQVTSLHFHFPWLVKSLLRWTIFCAATRRKVRMAFNWQPYFDIADLDLPFDEKLLRYDQLAREHFEADRFDEFCAKHLGHLDEVAVDFFGSQQFYDVTRQKVAALFPAHEIDEFSAHFFGLVKFWRKTEQDRLARKNA